MCGVFGYIGPDDNSASIVLDGLKQLEYRGYDSWGVAVIPSREGTSLKKKIEIKKRAGKIGNATVSDLPKGHIAFGHTRWATHGGVTQTNAHPHIDCKGEVAVIHNGIFENYLDIKEKLVKAGHKFISETDTEVIAHLIEEEKKQNSFSEAVRLAFLQMEGMNAIISMDNNSAELIAIRRGSPLVLGFGKNANYLASDPAALLEYTKDVYFLDDSEMAYVSSNMISVVDINTKNEKTIVKQHLTWNKSQIGKNNFPYFMEKEIYEQPKIISAISHSSEKNLNDMVSFIDGAKEITLVGCGTASYAAIAGFYLFSKIARKNISWAIGSEFQYSIDHLTEDSLVVALSQSGETMDILEPLKAVSNKGVRILALVNVLGSSLYRLADKKILIGAGPEKAVASTKAFTGKIAHLIILSYAMAGKIEQGRRVLQDAVSSADYILSKRSVAQIHELAKKLKDNKDLYILGRGISYPLSLETALKIKEISYIHSEGLAAGELKHGPLALIENGTPCIVYMPDDETYNASLAGAMEVKARGGYIIGVSSKDNSIFDFFVKVPDAKEATIIPNTIFAQLLAYYLTLEKEYDPDMPRNLAKSVTVK